MSSEPSKRTILFHRDYRGFSGGHLNVWQYFNHVRHSPDHVPHISFSKETSWDENNPWLKLRDQALATRDAIRPDLLFLAGLDWMTLDDHRRQDSSVPIINLIQNFKHAQANDPRYRFLKHKALRICVSEDIASAIADTGEVNGPVFAIPSGIDLDELPNPLDPSQKNCDLLIAALKQPQLGKDLARRLAKLGRRVDLLTTHIPRSDYLSRVNHARITIFLPLPTEGCYLPPLEGMMLATIVVCPAHVGTASDYARGHNCFQPDFTLDSISEAAEAALRLSSAQTKQMLTNARSSVARHDLIEERHRFLALLENVSQLWSR